MAVSAPPGLPGRQFRQLFYRKECLNLQHCKNRAWSVGIVSPGCRPAGPKSWEKNPSPDSASLHPGNALGRVIEFTFGEICKARHKWRFGENRADFLQLSGELS